VHDNRSRHCTYLRVSAVAVERAPWTEENPLPEGLYGPDWCSWVPEERRQSVQRVSQRVRINEDDSLVVVVVLGGYRGSSFRMLRGLGRGTECRVEAEDRRPSDQDGGPKRIGSGLIRIN